MTVRSTAAHEPYSATRAGMFSGSTSHSIVQSMLIVKPPLEVNVIAVFRSPLRPFVKVVCTMPTSAGITWYSLVLT
jgi:hypothetical protein